MEKRKCTHCGSALGSRVAICGACGQEVISPEMVTPTLEEQKYGRNAIYATLAVFLVVVGGLVLLFTGLIPNVLKSWSTVAMVNGEKISAAEVDQKLEAYKKSQVGRMDFSSPEGKKALNNVRTQIVQILIQERVLVTEAAKEKITVTPQEIAARIVAVKQGLNLSDRGFEDFLKKNATSLAAFEKRMERECLIEKLIKKGTEEKGLKKEAWLNALRGRATVELLE